MSLFFLLIKFFNFFRKIEKLISLKHTYYNILSKMSCLDICIYSSKTLKTFINDCTLNNISIHFDEDELTYIHDYETMIDILFKQKNYDAIALSVKLAGIPCFHNLTVMTSKIELLQKIFISLICSDKNFIKYTRFTFSSLFHFKDEMNLRLFITDLYETIFKSNDANKYISRIILFLIEFRSWIPFIIQFMDYGLLYAFEHKLLSLFILLYKMGTFKIITPEIHNAIDRKIIFGLKHSIINKNDEMFQHLLIIIRDRFGFILFNTDHMIYNGIKTIFLMCCREGDEYFTYLQNLSYIYINCVRIFPILVESGLRTILQYFDKTKHSITLEWLCTIYTIFEGQNKTDIIIAIVDGFTEAITLHPEIIKLIPITKLPIQLFNNEDINESIGKTTFNGIVHGGEKSLLYQHTVSVYNCDMIMRFVSHMSLFS